MTDNTFQSVLNKQRLDKFRMILTLPPILRDIDSKDWDAITKDVINVDSVQFSLHSATIPDVSIPSKSLPTMGQTVKVTSQNREAYDPVSCKYVIDNRFRNYWVLWKWLDLLNKVRESGVDDQIAHPTTYNGDGQIEKTDNYLDYQTIISIYPLDEYNEPICEFKFHNSFPIKLSGLNFEFQDSSQVEGTFDFEFSQMEVVMVNE